MPALAARAPAPASRRRADPQSDPRFKQVIDKLNRGSAELRKHPTPAKKAAEASAAAKGPPNERTAGAKAKQVDKIQEAPTEKPQPTSFLALLQSEIAKAMPKTLGDTEKFMKGGSSGQLKGSLKGNVNQQAAEASGGVESAAKAAPSEAGVQATAGKPIPPDPSAPAPAINAAEGMPAPKPDAEVSLQASKQDVDSQIKEAEVTPEQLQKANDPRFSAVLTAKSSVEKQADAGPAKYRTGEKGAITQAAAKAQAEVGKGAAGLVGVQRGAKGGVLTKQMAAKAKDEAARKAITDEMEAIYAETKAKVEAKLNSLETDVGAMFDSGVDAALNAMTAFVEDRLFRYKLERYLSIPLVGAARWIKDQIMDLPSEVNVFYEQGRSMFTTQMNALVVRVAAVVEKRLAEAKTEVANGQNRIKALVAKQPKELRAFAENAAKEVSGRFEELERGIDEKKNQIAQQLAQKYKEGFDKAEAALKKIQDENKGLVAAFAEKLGEVIKILTEFKEKLMSLLRKGADTIKLILADPIGFLGNLLAALKQGFNQFVSNIWTHLKKGFMAWLFGNLASAGIEIPSDLSLPSILKLVMSVLGLTYERMRAEAVKLIGPTAVTIIEKLVSYVKTLIQGGPAALWEQIKGDLSNLKAMVIDAIQDWLITTIIKKAVVKIVSMFNPAGAIVQAITMIYSVVMFVIERAAQIMSFVEAVINSVSAIAQGAIGGAATWIENSLARLVPVVIGLLASLIGLGGIGAKIKETITKVQDKVWGAIRKFLKKAIDFVKKMWGKLTGKKDDKKGTVEIKLAQSFGMHGEGHQVFAETRDGRFVLEVASQREELIGLTLRAMRETDNKKAKKRLDGVYSKLKKAEEKVLHLISDRAKDAEAIAEAKKLTGEAANQLAAIGVEFDIPSLRVIPHGSDYVETLVTGYRIKEKYAPKIRATFYPSGYEPETRTWKREYLKTYTDKNNKNNFIDSQGRSEPKSTATIDHQPRVVDHWEAEGKTQKQSKRAKWFSKLGGHLSVLAKKYNSSDGAEARNQGARYKPEGVGKDFGGPGEG